MKLHPSNDDKPSCPSSRCFPTLKRACGALALLALPLLQQASAGEAALYGGTLYYSGSIAELNKVKTSGFTTAVVWTLHVDANGDINLSGNPLVTDGVYVGDPGWPARFATLKQFPTTINRTEITVGAWGSAAYQNIKNQIAAYGTGPGTRLYRNFAKLREVTGADAISNDDEVTYDVASSVAFGNMLSNIGFTNTLCPYTNPGYWQQVKAQLGAKVDRVYLQCYDGGAGNNPADWNALFGGFKVMPGVWGRHYNNSQGDTPATVNSKMNGWRSSAGIVGGFYWMGDDLLAEPQNGTYSQYGSAILGALGGSWTGTYFVTNRASGQPLDANGAGTGNGTLLIQSSFHGGTNQQWRMGVDGANQFCLFGVGSGKSATVDGYSYNENAALMLWDYIGAQHQKFTLVDKGGGYYSLIYMHSGKAMQTLGNSVVQNSNSSGFNAQWKFQNTVADGTYSLRVRHTGLALDASGAGTANGTPFIQSQYHGGSNQRWNMTSLGGGQFRLMGAGSGRVATVDGYQMGDNVGVSLWDNIGALHQKFSMVDQGDGWFNLVFLHSGKAMQVLWNSTAPGAQVVQYTLYANGANSHWSFRQPY